MRKNVVMVAMGCFAIAGAVAATGFLLTRRAGPHRTEVKAPAPRRTAERRPAAPPEPARIVAPKAVPPPVVAAGPSTPARPPEPKKDLCVQVQDIVDRFDAVVNDRSPAAEATRIHSLRERSQKIDKLVEELGALGCDAVPCVTDQMRLATGSDRIARQSFLVRGLAKLNCRAATEALGQALSTSDAWGVKMTIVAQLAENGGADGLKVLADRVQIEEDFRVRGAILKYLGQKKSPEGLLVAERLAVDDTNPNVRSAAIRALGDGEDASAVGVLEDRARNDQDVTVRQSAIQACARVEKDRALSLLADLVARDPNLMIKSVAIYALQEIGTDGARQILEQCANDPNASVDARARASGALAGLDRSRQGGIQINSPVNRFSPPNADRFKPLIPAPRSDSGN